MREIRSSAASIVRAFVQRGEIQFPAAGLRDCEIRVGREARHAAGVAREMSAERTVSELRRVGVRRERDSALADERGGEKPAIGVALVVDDGADRRDLPRRDGFGSNALRGSLRFSE